MKHQVSLSIDGEQVTATCEAGDWQLIDSFDVAMLGARDHVFEKEHGVLLD